MKDRVRLGIIGADTSHPLIYARLTEKPSEKWHVAGARVSSVYPGGSPDTSGYQYVAKYCEQLQQEFNIPISTSIEETVENCDVVMINTMDGRVHVELLRNVISAGKPVFVNKPFALTANDAQLMVDISAAAGVPLMACSALRYLPELQNTLTGKQGTRLIGADAHGPASLNPSAPGLFYYGIHAVEMLFTAMKTGCQSVVGVRQPNIDLGIGTWKDGRIGIVRGLRQCQDRFGITLYYEDETVFAGHLEHTDVLFQGLLQDVIRMAHDGRSPLDIQIAVEIVDFISTLNHSHDALPNHLKGWNA